MELTLAKLRLLQTRFMKLSKLPQESRLLKFSRKMDFLLSNKFKKEKVSKKLLVRLNLKMFGSDILLEQKILFSEVLI